LKWEFGSGVAEGYNMGWKVRLLLVVLVCLMISLLAASVVSLASPELEGIGLLFVTSFAVNVFIALIALFKFSGKR
jgi:hypothetical protein